MPIEREHFGIGDIADVLCANQFFERLRSHRTTCKASTTGVDCKRRFANFRQSDHDRWNSPATGAHLDFLAQGAARAFEDREAT